MNSLSAKGAAFIRLHEGFRPAAYKDPVGILTIGIGFTWRSSSFREWWSKFKAGPFNSASRMTVQEADDALQYLVAREYGKAVNDFLGKEVPQHVYDAMVSAVYNLGPGALKWKWAEAARNGDYGLAASRLRVTGTKAQGRVLPGLVRRRKEEALLLEKGVYTGVKAVQPEPPANPAPPSDPLPEPETDHSGPRGLMAVLVAIFAIISKLFKRKTT